MNAPKKKTARRKTGRTPGSKTRSHALPRVNVQPAICPNCKGTNFTRRWPVRSEPGPPRERRDGLNYDTYRQDVAACDNCDTEVVLNRWEYQGDVVSVQQQGQDEQPVDVGDADDG